MTSCCHPHQMPWSGATGAIARCKRVSTGCGRKRRSVRVLRWICGVKLKPKAVNKPLPYFIVHELDKPGSSATVSIVTTFGNFLACKAVEAPFFALLDALAGAIALAAVARFKRDKMFM